MDNSYVVGADLYDFVVEYQTRPDVSFFVDLARQARGPVLELGCGTGRVLIPAARAGVEITGVDLSPQMLAVCDRKLQDESQPVRSRVRLVESDMQRFELSQKFALVTIPFRPFQHLIEVDDQLACLVHAFSMRYFFRYELEHLLARAGFAVETLYGDYDCKPYGEKYLGELIFVARKRV